MHLELCKNTFGGHGAGDRLRASGTPDANCARCLRDTYLPDEIMAYIDFVCGRTYILCLGLRLWTDVRPLNVCLDWSSSLAMIIPALVCARTWNPH